MKKSILTAFGFAAAMAVGLAACDERPAAAQKPMSNIDAQVKRAADAAASITYTDNQEIDNITKRRTLFAKPGGLMYIVLLNQAGQPIAMETVEGKITSGSKRLTPPDRVEKRDAGGQFTTYAFQNRAAPSDEGTFGSSGDYIYWWTTDGAYRQWNGSYFLSDQPIRLRVEPLVINVK